MVDCCVFSLRFALGYDGKQIVVVGEGVDYQEFLDNHCGTFLGYSHLSSLISFLLYLSLKQGMRTELTAMLGLKLAMK